MSTELGDFKGHAKRITEMSRGLARNGLLARAIRSLILGLSISGEIEDIPHDTSTTFSFLEGPRNPVLLL